MRSVLTRRRVIALVVVLVLAAAAYTAWLLYAAQRDLRAAEQDARDLRSAIEAGDAGAARTALDALQDSAGSAEGHTGGLWWSLLTVTPGVGDDLDGVRAISASLDEVATGAAPSLVGLTDDVDALVVDGSVDVTLLRSVEERVVDADDSLTDAVAEVDDLDSSGYVGSLRGPFEEYVGLLGDASRSVSQARTAAEVAPTLLGADGPRDYLLVFQNNAEIRASGGLSGAWARVHTDQGSIELMEQGSARDFPIARTPVTEVTEEETAVYGDVIARYFQDPVSVNDFPRAAELFDAFWAKKYPETDLDGVVTLDTVALSYLLRGTGPVTTGGYTLTPDNVVPTLLNQVYLDVEDPKQQDEVFSSAAGAIFTGVTSGVTSATDLVEAARQAVDERRLLLASFEDDVTGTIAGTEIAGEFGGDAGTTPEVHVTIDDATGSKMSYYLDYDAQVQATSCTEDGVQALAGSMTLRQTITADEAQNLPSYVTGGAITGVPVGSQQVLVRIYAPFDGTLGDVFIGSVKLPRFTVATIDGRESITVPIITDGTEPVPITWTMTSGPGQTAGAVLSGTPKVTPGKVGGRIPSAC